MREVEVMRRGGIVEIKKEKVYGIDEDDENGEGVEGIFEEKGRKKLNKLIENVEGIEMEGRYVDLDKV